MRSLVGRLAAVGACLGVSAFAANQAKADVVTDWNDVYLDTLRAVGGPPCPMARAGALLHVAMFDALQAIDRQYTPMVVKDEDPALRTNRKAAMAAAAHKVLTTLYPARTAIYDQALADTLAEVPDGAAETKGVELGVSVATKVLADHGGDDPFATDTNYVYANVPGGYQPTFPDFLSPPMNPGWGHCKPWCMLTGSQFRATRGPLGYAKMGNLLKSARYAEQYNEVKELGRRFSKSRTADQTEIAWFWANDRNGTYKPPGHMNALTQIVSKDHNLTMAQNARLFAIVNVALADAGILSWDQKFLSDIDLWRPITAIRNADTDGNPLTVAAPGWQPLLEFSPAFPGYISGHATFGGAWAAVMAAYFGTDNVTFVGTTDEPIVQNVKRTFTSFSQAGFEDALSRIYLGVHFRMDVEDGYDRGYKMGQTLASTFFQKTCRADLSRDGSLSPADLTMFTSAFFTLKNSADFNLDGTIDNQDIFDYMNAYNAQCK
jgi:hypothetical protein